MQWLMVYLAKFPKVQSKLHHEIEKIANDNNNKKIEICDSIKAHYTNAFIAEVFRLSSISDASLIDPHSVGKDVVFHGKYYPKGTQVLYFRVSF